MPGHQIVGTVEALGEGVDASGGGRPGRACPGSAAPTARCPYCRAGEENLCDAPTFTGYQVDGGYAEYAVARADFVAAVPDGYPDLQAAPLLCAGPDRVPGAAAGADRGPRAESAAPRLGLYGFGASAHIVIQVARHLGHEVYVCTRGEAAQAFALELGRDVGRRARDELPPVRARQRDHLRARRRARAARAAAVRKGGVVVCAGIHMSPIPQFDYELLWGERVLRSVANLTRADGDEFLELAPRFRIDTRVEEFPLEEANEALAG